MPRVVGLAEGGTKLMNNHSDAVELQGDEDRHKEVHCPNCPKVFTLGQFAHTGA